MIKFNYRAKDLIECLGGDIISDEDVIIECVSTLNSPAINSMMFFTEKKWKDEYFNLLDKIEKSFIIIEPTLKEKFMAICNNNCIVVSENARLYFAKALKTMIGKINKERNYCMQDNYIMGENVIIGENVSIEPQVFIDHDVVIGNNVIIRTGVKIRQNVIIEDNVIIGENSVIGAQGFGIEKDVDGKNLRIPHIGGVVIKENVEIGALSSIVSGTIFPTVIERNVFIDDLNHIAHNCHIGEGTLTTGKVEVGGSAKIGSNSYIAPNATIRNGISIGENCFIGQASSVQKSFGDNVSLVGNPAKIFDKKNN